MRLWRLRGGGKGREHVRRTAPGGQRDAVRSCETSARPGWQLHRRRLAYWYTKEDIEPWRSVTRVNDTTQINGILSNASMPWA